jgi:type II secretory pathway component PulF
VPLFRYEALDNTGNVLRGAMQVQDEHALSARLAAMGLQPTFVEAAGRATPAAAPSAPASPTSTGAPVLPVSDLTADDRAKARMFHQLHISLRAGMAAYQAVTTVAAQMPERSLREVLSEIGLGVRDGHSLSGLMERYPRLFTRGDVGMVRAAEMGGFLPEAVENLAVQHEQDDNTRRRLRIWVWFFHSNVITLFLLVALAFFFKAAISAGFDAMAGVRAVGSAFMTISLPLLALYFGALTAFYYGRNNPKWAYRWHKALLKLPAASKINYLRSNAVFTRTLQQLYHAGVASGTAWETASGAVPNLYLAERFYTGLPVVESTGRLSLAMQQVALLDLSDIGMVATGEATGEVPQALRYLADRYEEETRVALGSSVVRGAVSFTLWAFILGGLGTAVIAWGYAQGLNSIFKLFGLE